MKEYATLFLAFAKIGAFMFGGGYSMLPLLTRELVDRRKWTTEAELLDYFAIAQCTPGVIAINTATFIGYQRRGVFGGIVATLGVIFVPLCLILVIAALLQNIWNLAVVQHIFAGIRIAVAALILSSVIRLFRSSVIDWLGLALCILGFALIAVFNLSPVFVVLTAAVAGLIAGRWKTK